MVIEPDVFGDNRGWFMESYSKRKLAEVGIDVDFIQDNRSFSAEKPVCFSSLKNLKHGSMGQFCRMFTMSTPYMVVLQ